MTIGKKWVTLNTYKYAAPKREAIGGDSKLIQIDKEWLTNQIAPKSIDEFLSEYTYDDAEYLYDLYTRSKSTK